MLEKTSENEGTGGYKEGAKRRVRVRDDRGEHEARKREGKADPTRENVITSGKDGRLGKKGGREGPSLSG